MSLLEYLMVVVLSVQYCISFRLEQVGDKYENLYDEHKEIQDEVQGLIRLEKRGISSSQIASCVKDTNMYRSKHKNTPPLKWDAGLAVEAQKYAEKLLAMSYKSGSAQLIHEKPARGMGENLYWGDSSKPGTCEDANKAWYSEINDYSYAKGGSKNGYAVGHFTQLVWKPTTKFGIGIAVGKSIQYADWGNVQTFVVAKYQKPGNFYYIGKKYEAYTENVQPLKGKK